MANPFQTVKQLMSQGIEGYFAVKYAEFAKTYQHMQGEYRRLAERVVSLFDGGRIVEIGPGPAYVSIEIAKRLPDVEIVGLEISDTMIEIAKGNAETHGLSDKITLRKGDASNMPFEDSAFDFAVTSGSLHHWKKPNQVFSEIYRILRPGSVALISDLRKDAPEEKVDEFANKIDSKLMRWGLKHSFKEGYTARQIQEMMKSTRFAEIEITEEDISMLIMLRK